MHHLARRFTDHPASVDETYFEHMSFAATFAGKLLLAGCAATVHAILPWMFEKTASRIIRDLHQRMETR